MPTRRLLEALGCDVVSVDAGAGGARRASPEPDEASLAELGDLVRQSRLSVMPIPAASFERILALGRTKLR